MASWKSTLPSKYLKREDLPPGGQWFTIEKLDQELVKDPGGGPDELKPVLRFVGEQKGMILNVTNGNRIEQVTGEEDADAWVGQQILLYNDSTVEFGGKIVGGIRVKVIEDAPPPPPPPVQAPPPGGEPPPPSDDDVPF